MLSHSYDFTLGISCNLFTLIKLFIIIVHVCLLCIMSVGMHVDILDTEDSFVELVYSFTQVSRVELGLAWPAI